MKLTTAVRDQYVKWWLGLQIRPEWDDAVKRAADRIRRGAPTYKELEGMSSVPWYVIGVIHELESGCNFATHLHNGDLLTQRTRNEPRNRPKVGTPPFAFKQSAMDALGYDGLVTWKDWTVGGISYKLEGFNGYGYYKYGIPSPYLFSGSRWYTRGKYVADHQFSRTAVSKQVGSLVILKRLTSMDPTIQIPLR